MKKTYFNFSGIYKIVNLINNKIYIGSTIIMRKRRDCHFRNLKKGIHHNNHLQKSFNKYGIENFKFEVIEKCSKENLIEREQYYIDTLKPDYNICKIAGNILGIKRSKETCEKLSKSNTGYKQSYERKYNNSILKRKKKGKIYQFDLSMNLIKIWDEPISHIANKLNMKRTTISEGIRLGQKSKNFIFKVESEVNYE